MTTTPEPGDIVAATDRLTAEVARLGSRLRVSEEALKRQDALIAAQAETTTAMADLLDDQQETTERQSRWIKATVALVILMACGGIWLRSVAGSAKAASDAAATSVADTKSNAIRNCQNANESRRGAILLWTSIIDAPRPAGSKPRTSAQIAQLAELKRFILELYMERDCADLARVYPLPDPPKLTLR